LPNPCLEEEEEEEEEKVSNKVVNRKWLKEIITH
jgi:hypothetical protein